MQLLLLVKQQMCLFQSRSCFSCKDGFVSSRKVEAVTSCKKAVVSSLKEALVSSRKAGDFFLVKQQLFLLLKQVASVSSWKAAVLSYFKEQSFLLLNSKVNSFKAEFVFSRSATVASSRKNRNCVFF